MSGLHWSSCHYEVSFTVFRKSLNLQIVVRNFMSVDFCNEGLIHAIKDGNFFFIFISKSHAYFLYSSHLQLQSPKECHTQASSWTLVVTVYSNQHIVLFIYLKTLPLRSNKLSRLMVIIFIISFSPVRLSIIFFRSDW